MEKRREDVVQNERGEGADYLINFLDAIHAEQVLGSEETKREFIENMSFDDFRGWLERLNGMVRSLSMVDRSLDGGDVALVSDPNKENPMVVMLGLLKGPEYPPQEEDKEDLLKEMFRLMQKMSVDGSELGDIALLASSGVNAIHAFLDGNGRTSRLLHYLITTDYTKSDEQVDYLKKLLGDEGRLLLNINPGEAKSAITDYMFLDRLGIDVKDRSSPKGLSSFSPDRDSDEIIEEKVPVEFFQDFKRYIVGESDDFGFFAVYSLLKEKGTLNNFLVRIKDGNNVLRRTDLRVVDVVESLKPEDYTELFNKYWQFKKEGVSILMSAIAEPDKFKVEKSLYNPDNNGKTIKEVFLNELSRAQLRSFEEVNMENIADIWEEKDRLPFSVETISKEAIEQMATIRARLKALGEEEKQARQLLVFDFEEADKEFKIVCGQIEADDTKRQETGETSGDDGMLSEEALMRIYQTKCRIYKPVMDLEKKFLEQTEQFLDSLDIWKAKFTTRNDSQRASEEEKVATDSIYYITPSGQSLRIRKYALLEKGLSASVEPFCEKIIFADKTYESFKNKAKVSKKVKEGLFVVEYLTDEFLAIQDNPVNTEFVSHIRRYRKGNKIIYLNPVDGHKHRGYAINKILYQK